MQRVLIPPLLPRSEEHGAAAPRDDDGRSRGGEDSWVGDWRRGERGKGFLEERKGGGLDLVSKKDLRGRRRRREANNNQGGVRYSGLQCLPLLFDDAVYICIVTGHFP